MLLQEPPNLNEIMKPIQNASSPASLGLKDEDDDDAEGEEGDGEAEKADPANVNSERLKAFNVRTLQLYLMNFASTVMRATPEEITAYCKDHLAMFHFHENKICKKVGNLYQKS